MNIAADFQAIEDWIGKELTAAEHFAAAVIGYASVIEEDVNQVEANSPAAKALIGAGKAALLAQGIPVAQIEAAVEEGLTIAKQLSAPKVVTTTTSTETVMEVKAPAPTPPVKEGE